VSPLVLAGIALVGGVGAIARFALDGTVSSRLGRDFPYGTLAVNVLGAALLGLVLGASPGARAEQIVGTGLIGAFTTFSTWSLETHRLAEDGKTPLAWLNVVVSLVLGVAAAWAGRQLGLAL
jgi:CrcB protein